MLLQSLCSIFHTELMATPKRDLTAEANKRYSMSMSPFVACVEALEDDEDEGDDISSSKSATQTPKIADSSKGRCIFYL